MGEDQDTTDIGRAWEDALDKYCKDTGTNIKYLPQMKWSVTAIINEQQRQVETFNSYRHNKGLTDRLRSMISKNSDVIQSVANNIANSASSAFPPSAAILTAFTYVMKASKNVSTDYDQVSAFFEIMYSLMERLALLETKLPSAKNYKTILMRVFTSLMGLCGTATKYVTEGRFKHWLKALYKGTDDDIKADYTKLETNIQRLESATMFATLATVMETKSDVKDLVGISMQSLKVGTQTLAISGQTLSVSLETQTMVGGMSLKQGETLTAIKRLERRMMQKDEAKKEEKGGHKTKDAGAKKNAALNLVKTKFASPAEPALQLREIASASVPGTFGWVFEEEGFKSFMDGDSSLLWISGPPGIGKSCVAHSIIGKLLEFTGNQTRQSVAYFFYREEHEELRSTKNMLKAAVIQTAIGDGKYRDEVVAEVKRKGDEYDESFEQTWMGFFAERYPKDADQKLFIVLDGVDEADEEDQKMILDMLKCIKKDELSIQIVFTSRPTKEIQDVATELQPRRVEITKDKISVRGGDLWKIIMKRCKTLSKLKRLQKPALRKIGMKLRLKADSVLYVEHMLRRLNVLGRESLIFKELDKLPEDLPKLYELLLSECQKDRSKDQLIALKKLFAWLAYSKRPLTLGEATSLIKVIPGSKGFSLEEEIDGRSARILDLQTHVAEDESGGEESDSELNENQNDEESSNITDNSIASPLKFQERSMRQYFRAMEVDENGLRSSPSEGHLTIFDMAVRVLDTPEDPTTDGDGGEYLWQLREYAVKFWMQHFLDIDPETTSEDGVKLVITNLYTMMRVGGPALKNIENFNMDWESRSFFGSAPDALREQFFTHFATWLQRAYKFGPTSFSNEMVDWMSKSTSKDWVISQLALGHATNWLDAKRSWQARVSFDFTRNTLRMTRDAPRLSDNAFLPADLAEADILTTLNCFPDMNSSFSALKSVGMTFYNFQLYDVALAWIEKALQATTKDTERFHTLYWIGQLELDIGGTLSLKEDAEPHARKAYDAVNQSIALYQQNEEVKQYVQTNDMKILVEFNLTNRSRCEVRLGEIDKAIVTMDEAYAVQGDDPERSLSSDFLKEITAYLEEHEDFEKLMEVIGHFEKWDLLALLGFSYSDGHDTFQHAAWVCKKQDFLIKTYEKVISDVAKYNTGARVRGRLAYVYQRVFPNYDAAKRLLFEIVDGKNSKGETFRDSDEDFVFESRLQLADVLMAQFREAADPVQKIALHGEMKNLILQHNIAMGNDYNMYESQSMISLALMTGKMGPTNDFQSVVEKTFRACIDALTDNQAWNDCSGFRILAKVLAFVPEMKRDAQIAFSLQFSAVDDKLFNSHSESGSEAGDEDAGEPANSPEVLTNGQAVVPAATEDSTPAQVDEPDKGTDEDLNPNSAIWCDGCGDTFSNWNVRPVYGCIICTNCDLCENCWKKKDACNKGEPWTEWKTYCGDNHKYIKGPMPGWKGVKDGVLRIENIGEGELHQTDAIGSGHNIAKVEEIKFEVWLDEIQERWTEAWKGFWKREDLVVDIL
ncbi:uncharacterized protein PAC_07692 [Phialocephala subalpina]|uniref:Uncharacterized protein n=1 Tax=Phialocephala subalpina TaxID=576137 RepID=A0A1L7WYF9_9HELO|nr:uncharacterized protein PAC_07692 [Phialocephala subalpina]